MVLKAVVPGTVECSHSERIVLKEMLEPLLLPGMEIVVDDCLGFTVKVFGCFLLEDHLLYLDYERTVL